MGDIEQAGREAEDSETVDRVAQVGLVAYGLIHLLIGWMSIQLVLGDHSENPSAGGAFHSLAQRPGGRYLVTAVAVGLFLLVVWRALEAGFGHRELEGVDRVRMRVASAAQGVVYAALGFLAAKTAVGDGGSGGEKGLTAQVMSLPAGPALVVMVGVGILAVAIGLVWFGITEGFADQLATEGKLGTSGAIYLVAGRIGYLAKGAAFAIVGGLVAYAGLTHKPSESGGLDEALQKVIQQPFGPALLVAIGLGIGCFGLFCFALARHIDR